MGGFDTFGHKIAVDAQILALSSNLANKNPHQLPTQTAKRAAVKLIDPLNLSLLKHQAIQKKLLISEPSGNSLKDIQSPSFI